VTELAPVILTVFGIALCATCLAGTYSPNALIRLVKRVWDHRLGIYGAVVARALLGALLLLVASSSKFPVIFLLLGVLALVSAVAVAFIGRQRIGRFIEMFENLPTWLLRVWLMFAGAFGGLLIYGVW
jgi:predicted lysophospholipase L1 biosynthesis ABC-type transport system permease subunit